MEKETEISVGDGTEQDGDRGHHEDRGGETSVRFLQRENDSRQRRARCDGKARAGTARHQITLHFQSSSFEQTGIARTDGGTHLNAWPFVSERNAHEICQERRAEEDESALDPMHGEQASDRGDCGRNTTALAFPGEFEDDTCDQTDRCRSEDQEREINGIFPNEFIDRLRKVHDGR